MTAAPLAVTSSGTLRGTHEGGVHVFRGIPYAEPPVAHLRWRLPQSVQPWTGIRAADEFGPRAPQRIAAAPLAKSGGRMAEDCLYLNVWTPAIDAGRRPVLVFIHGGGLLAGSGSTPLTNGAELAARGDAVVITLNYRLGVLGSLYMPEVVPANLALHDQMLALRWVRREAVRFGGDPENVTLIGQSSGAVCVASLLASPFATGLFDRAVLQSGGLERLNAPQASLALAEHFLSSLGCAVSAMRDSPLDDVLAAQASVLSTGPLLPPRGHFHPTIDGTILPQHPLSAARQGLLHAVPLLLGNTAHEWRSFDAALSDDHFTEALLRERIRVLLRTQVSEDFVLACYRSESQPDPEISSERAIAAALVSDYHFSASTELLARRHAVKGCPVFRYVLNWPSPRPKLGARHDICLPLLFGTMAAAPSLAGNDAATRTMSHLMQDAWLAFARSNNPSTPALGEWPQYDPVERPALLLDREPRIARRHRAEQLAIWQAAHG
ncbi:MAG: carboxylesterase family protein [Steroidobacteraceae bacterium]